jgi:hypothetical protein
MTRSRLRIVVAGLIGSYPLGGMAWHYLQFVVGLMRLGHDVFYLEDSGRDPYNPVEKTPSERCSFNVEYLSRVMSRFAMRDRWAYRSGGEARWYGLSDAIRTGILASTDLLINVSGSLEHPAEYRMVRRLAYVDTDPVFTQLKLARGHARFRARIDAHDVHFSFGPRVGVTLPETGQRWRPARQPILLDAWHQTALRRDVYTTVMSWTSYKSESYRGRIYGHKDVEFSRFLELPALVAPTVLEAAIAGGRTASMPRALLVERGWRVVDPDSTCPDLDAYRTYIESSKGEWSIAKNAYVQGECGWFSERSACYLAAGRPVIVQDTGLSTIIPVGIGIVPFKSIEEAASAIREVEGNYPRHAAAARAIANEYFDSAKVLPQLVDGAFASDTPTLGGGCVDIERRAGA